MRNSSNKRESNLNNGTYGSNTLQPGTSAIYLLNYFFRKRRSTSQRSVTTNKRSESNTPLNKSKSHTEKLLLKRPRRKLPTPPDDTMENMVPEPEEAYLQPEPNNSPPPPTDDYYAQASEENVHDADDYYIQANEVNAPDADDYYFQANEVDLSSAAGTFARPGEASNCPGRALPKPPADTTSQFKYY